MLKDPSLFPIHLRVKLKSPSLAQKASHYLALHCPFCTKRHTIHYRLFWTISSSQNNVFVLYASCLFNVLFYPAQITILYLPAVLPRKLPFTFELTQELPPPGGNCSSPLGLNYVSLFRALIASGKASVIAITPPCCLSTKRANLP